MSSERWSHVPPAERKRCGRSLRDVCEKIECDTWKFCGWVRHVRTKGLHSCPDASVCSGEMKKSSQCIIFSERTCLETYLFPLSSSRWNRPNVNNMRRRKEKKKKHTLQSKPVKFFITQHKDIWMLKKTRQSSHYKMTKKKNCICPLIFLYFIIYN